MKRLSTAAALLLTAATGLGGQAPDAMMSWMGMPHIVMTTTSVATMRCGQVVRTRRQLPPSGDPTAGRALVERWLYFSGLRVSPP